MRFAAILIVATACSSPAPDAVDSLTRREKDSIVAESGLPGAGGVRGAIRESDSAARRAARLDSLSREP